MLTKHLPLFCSERFHR
uniref:Uncharacterized protein n=1 Tax=Anguilla anguilla TaxID=7936 RepID=A0A0E9XED1_ANGAN